MYNNQTTIRRKIRRYIRKIAKKYNNQRGWLLLAMVFFLFILTSAAIVHPLLRSSVQLSDTVFEVNRYRAEDILLTTNSPIRNYVVDQTYKRIQTQLIDHLKKVGGTTPYTCQGILVQPSSSGSPDSKLENQFGLCEPEKLFQGLDGNTNQTIDFNTAFGLKLDPTSTSEGNEQIKRALMKQNENSYDYTLRTNFVRQEVLEYGGIGKPRRELYHWLTRADVIATTNGGNIGDIRQPLVVYYDVYLINEFYPVKFYGSGSACDQQPSPITACGRDSNSNPNDLVTPDDCIGIVIYNSDGSISPASGDPQGNGIDTEPNGKCDTKQSTPTLMVEECPLAGGKTLRRYRFRSTRPQLGCASLSSGKKGITTPDSMGYTFTLTVRTVSIGSSYNK